jgi:phosphate transport system permease protein
MKVVVPAFLILVLWLLAQPFYRQQQVSGLIPDSEIAEGIVPWPCTCRSPPCSAWSGQCGGSGLITEDFARNARADFNDVTARLKEAGQVVTSQITQPILRAAQAIPVQNATGNLMMTIAVILAAMAGAAWGFAESKADFRARNTVEQGVKALLIAAASIAILTTIGIVFSLVFNTIEFFRLYPAFDFFFGLTWSPTFSGRGGNSQLGIIPLLWGTFYISFVALAVAVPIGLFAAVYLSEYADPNVRAVAKPLLEILAGYSDHRLRALRAADGRSASGVDFRSGRGRDHAGRNGSHDCGPRHGHHADPLREFAVGRHHQRGTAGNARRVLRPRRNQVRNRETGHSAGRSSGHRGCDPCWPPRGPSARR